MNDEARAEIIVTGIVQGVGYRYFVMTTARQYGLKGYVQNLYSGEVLTIVEGSKNLIEALYKEMQIGPPHAHVTGADIVWTKYKNEFNSFEVKY